MARKYLGKTVKLYPAKNIQKNTVCFGPAHKKWVNFGQIGYEDYTKHHDKSRRRNYLERSRRIKGHWKGNKYSPNNLSIHILW
jgi:hypothetical protein